MALDPSMMPGRGRTSWLAAQLRAAVADGTLAPGSRLPASRELATDLALSRGTVVEAYRRLIEEGLLLTNRGGGTVVAELTPVRAHSKRSEPAGRSPRHMVNISSGTPDLSSFPRAAWLRAERRVLATATSRELGYADPQGALELRGALAQWLARSRGIGAGADRIIVTAGVTGALSLLCQVCSDSGFTDCAVEDPGAEGNRRILDYWLDELHPIRVDAHGLDVSALAHTQARTVLVTPAHQFPTGVTLSPDRRRELIAWADDTDSLVIEDDYDSEYRYDRAPVRAMQPSAPERIAHISSLSKVLAPALRIGWLIAPTSLHDDLVRKRWATDLGSPALPQLTLAQLITTGVLERHLRGLRLRHRARRDAAVAAIHRHLPGCRIDGIAAGLHLVAYLPDHIDDTDLAARAEEVGIAVQPLSAHRFAPGRGGVVIGYGPHAPDQLEAAIATLGELAGLSRP